MRLYLSSYRLGDRREVLADLVGDGGTGWVVANALDGLDEARRRQGTEREIGELAALGLAATDLDLRDHDPASLAATFGRPDFLWVRGGNVFTLRAAMARSGLDELVVRGAREDAFVYAGYSAGGCVLAPSLEGLDLVDPVEVAEAEYGRMIWEGLAVLDRPFIPHLASPGHPETDAVAQEAARYDRAGQQYWSLRDGQALVVTQEGARIV